MTDTQIRVKQQLFLQNAALLVVFAGEVAKRRQKIIFAIGVRGEPSFFIYVLNPLELKDPDGRTSYSMSSKGKTLLKKLEGSVKNSDGLLTVYNDSNNNATKGYGLLLHLGPLTEADKTDNPPQTEAQATTDFENALTGFEKIVNNRTTYTFPDGVMTKNELSLTETQADALISLTYNSPATGKAVIDAIRAGKTDAEIKEAWIGGASPTSGVGKRREAEWKLYSEGTYVDEPY